MLPKFCNRQIYRRWKATDT